MTDLLPPDRLSVPDAIAWQKRMRERLVRQADPGLVVRRVAGADVSMSRGSDVAWAGIAVLGADSLALVDHAVARATLTFPYVPGLLSFRELPPLVAAWSRLATRPDVLVFDGNGYAHPRRFGLACHGGLLFDVPSIGCAKSRLVGTHAALGDDAGAMTPLEHRGEVVGMVVRLRARTNPLYVSAGHRMDLETAVRIVLSLGRGFREPETTRHAHRIVNAARKQGEGEGRGRGTDD